MRLRSEFVRIYRFPLMWISVGVSEGLRLTEQMSWSGDREWKEKAVSLWPTPAHQHWASSQGGRTNPLAILKPNHVFEVSIDLTYLAPNYILWHKLRKHKLTSTQLWPSRKTAESPDGQSTAGCGAKWAGVNRRRKWWGGRSLCAFPPVPPEKVDMQVWTETWRCAGYSQRRLPASELLLWNFWGF